MSPDPTVFVLIIPKRPITTHPLCVATLIYSKWLFVALSGSGSHWNMRIRSSNSKTASNFCQEIQLWYQFRTYASKWCAGGALWNRLLPFGGFRTLLHQEWFVEMVGFCREPQISALLSHPRMKIEWMDRLVLCCVFLFLKNYQSIRSEKIGNMSHPLWWLS